MATIRTSTLERAAEALVAPADERSSVVVYSEESSSRTSLLGITDQSSITSEIGTGIYLRASSGTMTASCLELTAGISITDIRDEANGMEIPHFLVVILTSFSLIKSVSAWAILSVVSITAWPTPTPT